MRLGIMGGMLALASMLLGGPAASGKGEPDAIIKMKFKRGIPLFKGPDTIVPGGLLQVENRTDTNAFGPHSFSIVKKSELPINESQRRKCGDGSNRRLICKDIAEAHDIEDRHADIPIVDNGETGVWDAAFDGENPGDSWYSETQFETHSRTVGESGKLRFLCITYPKMQGSIKIASP